MFEESRIKSVAMAQAAQEAWKNIESGNGGPFGAAIVKDGEIIAVAANSVLEMHDPTAHAEVNAIRKAAAALSTHDLSGCTIYATGYPCPMCLAAIIWANISECYYAQPVEDAAEINFRDEMIYEFIRGENELLKLEHLDCEDIKGLYQTYAENNCQMY